MTENPQGTGLTTADIAREEREKKQRGGPGGTAAAPETPLFQENEVMDLRSRWDNIQASFVDEPRKAVEQADQLVATTMKRLAEIFSSERDKLEAQWDRGDNISTEDLRLAIQRYRSFFARLLSV